MWKNTKKLLATGLAAAMVFTGVNATNAPEASAETVSNVAQGAPAFPGLPPMPKINLDPRVMTAVGLGVAAVVATVIAFAVNSIAGSSKNPGSSIKPPSSPGGNIPGVTPSVDVEAPSVVTSTPAIPPTPPVTTSTGNQDPSRNPSTSVENDDDFIVTSHVEGTRPQNPSTTKRPNNPTTLPNKGGNQSADREEFIGKLRDWRTANGFPGNTINPKKPVNYSKSLNNYADYWSSEMARTKNYNHGPKIPGRVCQENIMMHYTKPSVDDVFNAWKNSPGHNQTMLTSEYKDIGYSTVYGNGAYYSTLIMCR